jgi:choline dehydrogenase-like flavoprotein
VIVGAGSAGCVLASRLSEDAGARVLVLEAGAPDRHPNIKIPAAFAKQFRTKLDWDYNTEPEPHCEGRSIYIPRGKALGGSSSMNAMVYMRGRPQDYDRWREAGCPGWGWDDLLPLFKRAECNSRGPSELHGDGGPLQVTDQRSPRPLTRRWVAAAEALGLPGNRDFNGDTQEGVGLAQVYQKGGRRWSNADAYLRPAMRRPNLTVATRAHATAIALDGGRATGVRYRDRRGRKALAWARREVVVAAGAIASPQLLMLSGIGPAAHLRAVGIEAAVDAPGVGGNLQDHPYVVVVYESTVGGSLADAERPRALLEYVLRRSGPLTSNVAEACAFVRSDPDLPEADLQFHFGPAYFVENGFADYDGHALTMGPVLISPRSRGRVELASADPTAKPRILTNTLAEPEDVAALVAGVRIARQMAATEPLAEACGRELFPGPELQADGELELDLRRRVELLYHPVGTCRMGSDDEAVVDPELRVRDVDGLRVADASVMPRIVAGNTNAATSVIADRAADLILASG